LITAFATGNIFVVLPSQTDKDLMKSSRRTQVEANLDVIISTSFLSEPGRFSL
jgi:hypothetical protein